jgi:MacB-like periplasmic core domain
MAQQNCRVMDHREIWKISLDALRANKIQAFLTMLGIVIGSACIVLVVTISLTGRNYIVAQVEAAGSNLVYAEMRRTGAQATTLGDEITLADLKAAREMRYVVEAAGTHDLQMSVVAGGIERPVTLVAVTEGFQRIRHLLVVTGRYFDDGDMHSHAKTCLVTEELARAVFPGVSPVGQEIRVGELRFMIIGVFKERIATFGQSEIARESIIVPFGLMKSYAGTDTVKVSLRAGFNSGKRSERDLGNGTTSPKPPSHRCSIRRSKPEGDSGSRAQHIACGEHCSSRGGRYNPDHQWHWHHECHVGDRHPAHSRDWCPQSNRRR